MNIQVVSSVIASIKISDIGQVAGAEDVLEIVLHIINVRIFKRLVWWIQYLWNGAYYATSFKTEEYCRIISGVMMSSYSFMQCYKWLLQVTASL